MVIQAMNINTDSSFSRPIDPDMALGSSLGLDIIMDPVAAQVTQICMVSVVTWPLDNNMVLGG